MNRSFAYGFAAGLSTAVVALCLWAGVNSPAVRYFVQIPELKRLDAKVRSRRVEVIGRVEEGSIVLNGSTTTFVLAQRDGSDPGEQLKVVYTGKDLPDTFREHAQALVEGAMGADGVFHANKVLAKSM